MDTKEILNAIGRIEPILLPDISALKFMNRTDSKFLLPSNRLPELISMLDDRYKILEINNSRALPYSTKYFDTSDYALYYQHIRRKSTRYKLRYRTYLSSGDTFLEIKKKKLNNRTSKYRIPACNDPEKFDKDAIAFLEKNFPLPASGLQPSLINTFSRITLAGLQTHERVTLDYGLTFYDPRSSAKGEMEYLSVVELKREGLAVMSPFYHMLRRLDSYPSGFSKYVMGLALLNDKYRKNAVKLRFIKLKKIENEFKKEQSQQMPIYH